MCQQTPRVPWCTSKKGDEAQERPFVMTFADTIERYGSRMEKSGLVEAYKRVGRAFHGQLEQHFVVLKDDQRTLHEHPAPAGQAKKRPMEEQEKNSDGSNKRGRGRGARGGRADWRPRMARK